MKFSVPDKWRWQHYSIGIAIALIVVYLMASLLVPHLLQKAGTAVYSFLTPQKWRQLRFISADKHGHFSRFCRLIKEELEFKSGYRASIIHSEGSLENLERIRKKEVDFALIQGGIPYSNRSADSEIRGVAAIGWQYVHIIVPADSDIREFRDLHRKRVSFGPKMSGNVALGKRIFSYFWPNEPFKPIHSQPDDIVKDLDDKRYDAIFTVYGPHAPVIEVALSSGRFRLVPIADAESVADRIMGSYPASLLPSLYGPDRTIPNRRETPFSTVKVKTYLVTHTGVSRYKIDTLLNAIYSPSFINKNRDKHYTERAGRLVDDFPLSRAAYKFYSRKDPVTSDMYEIASAFLAAFVFFAGIVNYVRRRRHKNELNKKKKEIIPYFEELIAYGDHLAQSHTLDELEALLQGMMNTQRAAEKKWLEGKLDTEHMENLYAIYGIRCENTYNKMVQIRMEQNKTEKVPPKKNKKKNAPERS